MQVQEMMQLALFQSFKKILVQYASQFQSAPEEKYEKSNYDLFKFT